MKKIFSVLAALLITMFFPAISVCAAETTRDISVYLYQDYSDCVFLISWENAERTATVQIKSPDETIIPVNSQNDVFGQGRATVNVGNAASGYWTVSVTGENLGGISISGGNKNDGSALYNAIQSFTAEVSGNYIDFKWSAVAEQDTVNVSITAVQGDNRSYSVWNDYSANKAGTTSVSADELQTGLYSFTIQVHDGEGQHTLTTDEPVYIKQSNAPEKLEGIRAGSIDGEMFATWNARLNDTYSVTLYDYETLSVISSENVSSNYYPVMLPEGIEKVKLSVAAIEDNIYGDFDVFEIVSSTPTGTITFPEYSATRENSMKVYVDCPAEMTAGVYLDGTLLIENASAGDYDLTMSEGTHEVIAYIKDTNGNMKTFSKAVAVDKTPPVVNLNIADSVEIASPSFVIEGNTEPNAAVAINGVEQELGSGSFMAKLALQNGVNPISVSAYDIAGNKSVRTIRAERVTQLNLGWTAFILPGIVFFLLMAWYIYLNKRVKGAQSE